MLTWRAGLPMQPGVSSRAGFDPTFWIHHMKVGVWLSVAVIAMSLPYIALTPDGPNRPALLLALTGILAGTLALLRLPWDRLMQGTRGLVVFYSWSGVIITCIVGLAMADGGLTSPFAFTMSLPLIFATMAYPLAGLIGVTAACIVGLVVVGVSSGAGVGPMLFIGALEVLAGVMGGLIADNHRRSHLRQLALQGELERLASATA